MLVMAAFQLIVQSAGEQDTLHAPDPRRSGGAQCMEAVSLLHCSSSYAAPCKEKAVHVPLVLQRARLPGRAHYRPAAKLQR